jgi:hypothetical protein
VAMAVMAKLTTNGKAAATTAMRFMTEITASDQGNPNTVADPNWVPFANTAKSASRIFAGQRFRYDEDAGQALGGQVADFVVDHSLAQLNDRGHNHHHAGFGRARP